MSVVGPKVVGAAGFEGFEITWRAEVFANAPEESSAAESGTVGINYRAHKPSGGK